MLVSFEGLPGAGKTTQATLLADCLRRQGHSVVDLPDLATLDTEPIAATLTELLAASGDPYLRSGDAITDTMLTAAIRADFVATLLDPALAATPNAIVIEDRGIHTMASYATASLRRDHHADPRAILAWLQALTTLAGPRPTRALWLRLPPELAIRRAAARGTPAHAARPEHHAYLDWVNHAYTLLADNDPHLTPLDVTHLDPEHAHQLVHQALSRPGRATGLDLGQCAGCHQPAGSLP